MLEEIIDGVEMDLTITRYETFAELRQYCYRVASAVGLVSIEIFGYRNPACKEYAIELGLALQVTNIVRDVRKDLENGRIYLPREDLTAFKYSETELAARVYDERFVEANAVRSGPCGAVFSKGGGASAARGPERDGQRRDHGLDLSCSSSQDGAGSVPGFRARLPIAQVDQDRSRCPTVAEAFLNSHLQHPS